MKKIIFLFFITQTFYSQTKIDNLLLKHNKKLVPYIAIQDFKKLKKTILLDTREQKEFDISHIENANCVGYDAFNSKKIKAKYKNLNDTIIVYCSVGIRSEIIGYKLMKMGYKNVFNLYGGIFGWKNNNQKVIDNNKKETDDIHTFSKEWSGYLIKGIKIY
jgi:rhodanese-related sulfurtransferase